MEKKNEEIARKELILQQRSEFLARPINDQTDPGPELDCLEFILSGEHYLINAEYVSEVVLLYNLAKLPCTPPFIVGITNIGGKILSVIDLKKILNLPKKGITNLNRVIRVKHREIEVGLLVDEVLGKSTVKTNSLLPPMTTLSKAEKEYIIGIFSNQSILLDIEKFLSDKKIIIHEEI